MAVGQSASVMIRRRPGPSKTARAESMSVAVEAVQVAVPDEGEIAREMIHEDA
jgi:hypothetical protein